MNTEDLFTGICEGNRQALAKSISFVENKRPEYETLMSRVFKRTGNAHIVGISGPPGVGKSSLVHKIALEYRCRNKTIGIIAVDPTSPFTGGALLGDRTRMSELSCDKNIFIRSMGTRGHHGGLAQATSDVVKLMDAFGKDIILVETVGAGQSEVDIAENADTTLIVGMPGCGDDIQAIKAGLFEIADIFVVNKSDLDGCEKTALELKTMLEMSNNASLKWQIPLLKTSVYNNSGIKELIDCIQQHSLYLKNNKLLKKIRYERLKYDFQEILKEKLLKLCFNEKREEDKSILESMKAFKMDPYTAADKIISKFYT